MSSLIPSMGPDEGAEHFKNRHLHSVEREMDAMQPEWKHRHDEQPAGEIPPPVDFTPWNPPAAKVTPPRTSSTAGLASLRAGASLLRDAGLDPDVAEVVAETMQAGVGVARGEESSVAAFDRGEESGRVIGLRAAVRIVNGYRDALKGDVYSDDTIVLLDSIREDLVKAVES